MNITELSGMESTPNLRNMDPLYHNIQSTQEIRKRSVQDVVKKPNKFRNQTNLTSGDDEPQVMN